MKNRRRINRPMMAAGIMLCLVLLSAHFASVTYARYATKTEAGDKARAAKFEVDLAYVQPSATGEAEAEAARPGELTAEKNDAQITISNSSEVAVRVKLRIEFASAAKDYLKAVTLKNGQTAVSGGWKSNSETVYEFPAVVDLAPGASVTCDLTMEQDPAANPSGEANTGWKGFSNNDTDTETGTINYVIIAGYTQID